MIVVPPSGPRDARIAIVGEAPGADEERQGIPFVGLSGRELDKALHEAGIMRTECYVTNCIKVRPKDNDISTYFLDSKCLKPNADLAAGIEEMKEELNRLNPRVVIAVGRTALFALTGETEITSWRGSLLPFGAGNTLVPTYHPAAILRQWSWRPILVHDLRRAKAELELPSYIPPIFDFTIAPTLDDTLTFLKELPQVVTADIETIKGIISCVAIATSATRALCIPFNHANGSSYWSEADEVDVLLAIHNALCDPTRKVVWQNGLFDLQYFARFYGFMPNYSGDTMIAQSVLFPSLPKSLDFLASMYCKRHVYWKDDLKSYKQLPKDINKFWAYNCTDAVRTFEVMEVLGI